MQASSLLSLEKHHGPYEKWPQLSRLYANGKDTGKKIPGYEIVGQYTCDAGYLVITSQDCPHSESNDFLLLSNAFDIIAKKQLAALYSSFLLNDHWPISNVSLRLHYSEDLFYTLTIKKASIFCWRRMKLSLEPFKDINSDAKSAASLASLREQLRAVRDTCERIDPPAT